MRLVSIVGARPEFVQAVCLSRALATDHEEVIVHTGQHYDYEMSQRFFDELPLPPPAFNLEVGPGSRVTQLALMLARLEEVVGHVCPDAVIVRGDTTSTLAGAIVASQMGIPLVHLEAGERSYNRCMPEETNRVVADQLADVHFCASRTAVSRLSAEGITRSVHWVGDVMCDALLRFKDLALSRSTAHDTLALEPGHYALVTIHRAGNVDDPARLSNLVSALNAAPGRIVFPVHPRTRTALDRLGVAWAPHVSAVEPVGYFDMLALTAGARLVATDSGGLQREAYCLGVPCLTFREETEWTETVQTGWAALVGSDPAQILASWTQQAWPAERPPLFGDGRAAERIVDLLDSGVVAQAVGCRAPQGSRRVETRP